MSMMENRADSRWSPPRASAVAALRGALAAQYALLTDNVLRIIEATFPGSRADPLACAAAKTGMVADEAPALQDIRAWFERHHRRVQWQSEARMFVLAPENADDPHLNRKDETE